MGLGWCLESRGPQVLPTVSWLVPAGRQAGKKQPQAGVLPCEDGLPALALLTLQVTLTGHAYPTQALSFCPLEAKDPSSMPIAASLSSLLPLVESGQPWLSMPVTRLQEPDDSARPQSFLL